MPFPGIEVSQQKKKKKKNLPVFDVFRHLQVLDCGQAEKGEEQPLQGVERTGVITCGQGCYTRFIFGLA